MPSVSDNLCVNESSVLSGRKWGEWENPDFKDSLHLLLHTQEPACSWWSRETLL